MQSIIAMREPMGQHMTQPDAVDRPSSPRVVRALVFAGAVLAASVILSSAAGAQALGFAPAQRGAFP